nr:MAG TPA: hypothetical protein [Caudoviricetes sp.]DAZ05593.1 MAG TPA: hypothetical protein [Caudoviricetes sp.]
MVFLYVLYCLSFKSLLQNSIYSYFLLCLLIFSRLLSLFILILIN